MPLDLGALSDGELATLSLAGREAAFREIVRRHQAALFRLARAHTGDAEDALDVVQEALVSAHSALSRYDAARSLKGWLAAITLNKCRDLARRRRVRRLLTFALPLEDASTPQPIDTSADPEAQVADREALHRTAEAIARLPDRLKEVLILRAIEGLDQAETAALLGIGIKAVETRLYRARAKLSEVLAGE